MFFNCDTSFDLYDNHFDFYFIGLFAQTDKRYYMDVKVVIDDNLSFICGEVDIRKDLIHFKESYALHCCLDKILYVATPSFCKEFYERLYKLFRDVQNTINWLE